MAKVGGYILAVPKARAEILLDPSETGALYFGSPYVSEPVPKFNHSRRSPLIVFASLQAGSITHLADGKKGASAGTGLVKLNLKNLIKLTRPVSFTEILSGVEGRIRPHLRRKLVGGGLLPEKSLRAFVNRLIEIDPEVAYRLARFSEERQKTIRHLGAKTRRNLALQKDTLNLALSIAGLPNDAILDWEPPEDGGRSFLDGLSEAKVREDAMLLADFSNVPGFDALGDASHIGSKTFALQANPAVRLTVVMANRLPLEQQTGADLIYYNETYESFIMVQYKAMEKRNGSNEFRWQDGGQFCQEIDRMDALMRELEDIQCGDSPEGFRLNANPFYLKFCARSDFNPDERGLFKGIYLPLELWRLGDKFGRFLGPNDGKVLTYENVGRRINNSEFVSMVSGAWVGTSIEQSSILSKLIRQVLSGGASVTFAVRHGDGADAT